jgi:CubicO group peptidase (beta-lactamase class C family)
VERADLERTMAAALDRAAADPEITGVPDFTLVLETAGGHRFVHSHGDSSIDTRYESASTSKWVAASVILDLVDRGVLALTDEPSEWLAFWRAEGVTLAQLLSFTSGFSVEVLCFNVKTADFADCVERAYAANVEIAPPPGSVFDYSSTHLQIAGLMAIRAAAAASWAELFADWQARTGLFPTSAFDLPSLANPRLAGGMHWTAREYLEFLRAIQDRELLTQATLSAMLDNQRGSAEVLGSPALASLNQDWAYGFGNWLECPTASGAGTFDCGSGHRNSSPGAYGAYPFIDFDHRYFGVLARQGALGTFRDGDALFGVVAGQAARWAESCPSPNSE